MKAGLLWFGTLSFETGSQVPQLAEKTLMKIPNPKMWSNIDELGACLLPLFRFRQICHLSFTGICMSNWREYLSYDVT